MSEDISFSFNLIFLSSVYQDTGGGKKVVLSLYFSFLYTINSDTFPPPFLILSKFFSFSLRS